MRDGLRYILLLTVGAFLLTGCDVDMYEREICTYTVQLQYSYNEENKAPDNRITYWITAIDEYIFDENEILYSIRRVTKDMCTEHFNSEMQLPPGQYSIVAVGNGDTRSVVFDARTGREPAIGVTRREDMDMSLRNADRFPDGSAGPCEELFHGYRTFTVRELGASRIQVDMINAHFQLRFRITWKGTRATLPFGDYYAVIEQIPSSYGLMPEYLFPKNSFVAEPYDHPRHDTFLSENYDVLHHIPHVCYSEDNLLTHTNSTYLNVDREIWGQFVNYRIKGETRPMMTLYYAGEDNTRANGDEMILPRPIDLGAYFEWYGINLDHELKQEYALEILVDGNQIVITPMGGLTIADWTDGGILY